MRGDRVTNASLFNEALETTSDIWESQYQIKPVLNIRMPVPDAQMPVTINALWTDRGLRPSSNNLAFLIQDVSRPGELERWKQRLRVLPIRGGLLVDSEELHLLQPSSDSSSELEYEILDIDAWHKTLVSSKPHLFTPKALSQFREGQLSLADLEETVSERSFTFLTRQQAQLDEAFQQGIDAALKVIEVPEGSGSSRAEIKGHVIRFSIAYLAARILQDKNFFGSGASIHNEDQDPITLLDRMVNLTNGFFRRAKESEIYVLDPVRQALVDHMGYRVSFVLTDHRDVGRLYERAIKKLPTPTELSGEAWGDLNRHYTPVKIAERMLEALPLERLRPEERYIFDPAAGSGSLLLAATSRLANMTDIPTGDERKAYLKNHVAGNDLDRYADLIAQLRYFLASESLGKADEVSQITDVLPFPSKPNFTHKDYEKIGRDDLPIKPKVIVANPPFAEDGKSQKAAKFVQKALEWLDEGSQFAFVLPQSFLAGTTLGFPEARELLAERCQVLDVWQFPEHSVGIKAEQAVCVVSGIVSQPKKIFPLISKAIFSRVKEEVKSIRQDGFLGVSWLTHFNAENSNTKTNSWQLTVAPSITLNTRTILLGELFYVFGGITPRKTIQTEVFFILWIKWWKLVQDTRVMRSESEELWLISFTYYFLYESTYKRNWRLSWRDAEKMWADPQKVPESNRWVKYKKNNLKALALENTALFDVPKLLIGRKVNRGSKKPLATQWDDTGFCPDNNVYCVLPSDEIDKYSEGYQAPKSFPSRWLSLSYTDKCLWLLGICASKIANSLSLIGRKNHEITVAELCRIPLPFEVDSKIIDTTRQIIDLEKRRDLVLAERINDLRQTLDHLVEESYGNPLWKEITRVGKSPELDAWQVEQSIQTKTIIGQVLEISKDNNQVYMYISRLMDDDDIEGVLIPLPQELPGWALDGTPFEAELSHDVKTFEQLRERPWALRKFRHTPRPYLTDQELDEFLRIPELEVPL